MSARANDCSHASATGVDQAEGPGKVWRCDHCGLTWQEGSGTNPVATLAAAVQHLKDAMPTLLEACTDPEAADMAELLLDVREQSTLLATLTRDLETEVAKAMVSADVFTNGLRVERYRSADRKAWQHTEWQRDVRAKAIRAAGLLGATVVDANGEVLPEDTLQRLLADVQSVHGSANPKTSAKGGLRMFGLDAADYCETSPGAWHVRVQRTADDSTTETEQEGETDAA